MIQARDSIRLDLVCDIYIKDSLKEEDRYQRGKGVRRKVTPKTPISSNWSSFLRDNENKTKLFSFLAQKAVEVQDDKVVLSTTGDKVICNNPEEALHLVSPCNREEADLRLLLHVLDASQKGFNKILIRTVDTDVVCFGDISVSSNISCRALGRHWKWEKLSLYTDPSNRRSLRKVSSSSPFPRFHWL